MLNLSNNFLIFSERWLDNKFCRFCTITDTGHNYFYINIIRIYTSDGDTKTLNLASSHVVSSVVIMSGLVGESAI